MYRKREWHELLDQEKDDYYHWVFTLIEAGQLDIESMDDVDAKAKSMYEADHRVHYEDDPLSFLNFKE